MTYGAPFRFWLVLTFLWIVWHLGLFAQEVAHPLRLALTTIGGPAVAYLVGALAMRRTRQRLLGR